MDYETLIGNLWDLPDKNFVGSWKADYDYEPTDYEKVRGNEVSGTIKFDPTSIDHKDIVNDFIYNGYYSRRAINKIKNRHLAKHVIAFRCRLDCYYHIAKDPVFPRDEIYYRCLTEGTDFTKFIKKSRAQSLQSKIAIDEPILDEQYVHEKYSGYDSIINERYLIYWDDLEEVNDWIYSLLPPNEVDEVRFRSIARIFLNDIKWDRDDAVLRINTLEEMKGSKVYNPVTDKTCYKRDGLTEEHEGFWMAKRRVVPTHPGSTRDTGVPDPITLNRIKMLNQLARQMSEKSVYSLNADIQTVNKRITRLRKRDHYIHVDFKKYGLMFNRRVLNIFLEEAGYPELGIEEFTLVLEGRQVKTKRGGVLGWFDSMVMHVVSSILHFLRKRHRGKFDFIIFNDDVEIGTDAGANYALFLRDTVIRILETFDFIMSHDKIYVSEEMVILEQYHKFNEKELDMQKRQLLVKQFSTSLLTEMPWRAKVMYAIGAAYLDSTYLRERCINTIPYEFCEEEVTWPVEFGGWHFFLELGVNVGWREATPEQIDFALALGRFKSPHLTPKSKRIDLSKLAPSIERRHHQAERTSLEMEGVMLKFDEPNMMSPEELMYRLEYIDHTFFIKGVKPLLPEIQEGVEPGGSEISDSEDSQGS